MRDLGQDGEAAWQMLRQHAEWAEGVWFSWLFVASPVAIREVIERFDALSLPGAPSLVLPLVRAEDTIQAIFAAGAKGRRAVWVVGQGLDVAPWESLHLLLNERRERIRRHLAGGLLFVGRPEWKERARVAAPDLWSQRLVIVEWSPEPTALPPRRDELRTQLPAPPVEDPLLVERGLARARERGDRAGEGVALTRLSAARLAAGAPAEAHEHAVRAVGLLGAGQDRGRALAALAAAERALGDSATAAGHWLAACEEGTGDEAAWWGIEAGRALEDLGRGEDALAAFERAKGLAVGERTRAVVLNQLGEVLAWLGRLHAARSTLRDGLALARGIVAVQPEDSRAKQDLARALGELGDVARALGDLEGAARMLEESVALRREIVRASSTPETVRSLSVGLGRLSEVEQERGDLETALQLAEAAVRIDRQLCALTNDSAESLRDLCMSLGQRADIACEKQELDAAHGASQEAVDLSRRLRLTRGDIPEALHDVAAALDRHSTVERARGDLAAARAAREESLDLIRELARRPGSAPELTRDLAVSLEAMGDILAALGDRAGATRAYQESVDTSRDALRRLGSLPVPCADLARALASLHSVSPSPALIDEARALAATLNEKWPSPKHRALADWIASLA